MYRSPTESKSSSLVDFQLLKMQQDKKFRPIDHNMYIYPLFQKYSKRKLLQKNPFSESFQAFFSFEEAFLDFFGRLIGSPSKRECSELESTKTCKGR